MDWLLNAWDAVRIQSRNQDGAWACALIVLKPDSDRLDTLPATGGGNDLIVQAGTADAAGAALAVSTADARLRGIWYDSDQTYATADNGLHHCDPVDEGTSASIDTDDVAPLPGSASEWTIDDVTLTRNT